MKLVKLPPSQDNKLITCHLCRDTVPRHLASDKGWVVDSPEDRLVRDFYCLDCQCFLIKKMDMH